MNHKIVYQCNPDGWYLGEVEADEDPLEPGRYLIPAHAVETAPPARPWPDSKVPRWVGHRWMLQSPPVNTEPSPVEKLAAFLAANPDVAALINPNQGAAS